MNATPHSTELFDRAKDLLPGGVDSPVRAFRAVGRDPLFIDHGSGATIFDADGNQYIDYVLSWGPLILGHAHPSVVRAIRQVAEKGTSYGAPTELETALAERIVRHLPSIEMVRFVNSGTEATMSAIRVARAYTGRDKIVKFEGCYHGHADMLLVKAGSGVATLGLPDSPGVPRGAIQDTLVARYNDLNSVETLFQQWPGQVAAVIVEPVAGNMGVIPPTDRFLEGLRTLTSANDALLIFDEVMTGFRVGPAGAQGLYGIQPDLTTLGKVIGGGLPVGAYGGRRDVMKMVAPQGPVYQAGTLSGNPLAMAAGAATLDELERKGAWEELMKLGEALETGLRRACSQAAVPAQVARVGTMFGLFFNEAPVMNWEDASSSNKRRFSAYFNAMLDLGIYLAPSQFEAGFISLAHGEREIEATLRAAGEALQVARSTT